MKGFKLYLDEDASSAELAGALRRRDIDALTVSEAGMNRRLDAEQLAWAAENSRVIYTFNARDYCKLHKEIVSVGGSHAGLIIGIQQRYSIGEQLRRLLTLLAEKSQDEMRNEIEFLSNWGHMR